MKTYSWLKNFKASEFKCPCGCNNNPDIDEKLLYILQFLRNNYSTSVTITSGYRCQKYNDKLEGSIKNSDHIKGKAADFKVYNHCENKSRRKEVMLLIQKLPCFKYAYCDGWYITPTSIKSYSAKWMGNAIHISVE